MYIGSRGEQALDDAYPVDFAYRVAAAAAGYLNIMLTADEGPLRTSDYRIVLEAVPLGDSRTLLHLAYSYSFGFAGHVAMQAYLNTVGRDKHGFTVTGKQSGGAPVYIDGMRGLVERNTMRYYLAIDSFLQSAQSAPSVQLEERLQTWFTAVEQYPRQLHEMDRTAYLEMKHAEVLRQQTAQ